MNINDRVKEVLRYTNMRPSPFADYIGVAPTTILNIIKGKRQPGREVMNKILDAFPMIEGDWLNKGVGEMLKTEVQKNQSKEQKMLNTDDNREIAIWLLADLRESVERLNKVLDRLSELLDKNAGKL